MSRAAWAFVVGSISAAVATSIAVPLPKTLIWNASASVAIGLYAVRGSSDLEVPDLVAVMPPEPLARFLEEGGYLPRGVPMLKRVAALPGQTFCRQHRSIIVDGVVLGEALERDHRGRRLPVWEGCRRVGEHELFLMNFEVRDSLDGRYFGPIPRSAVIGRAVPLYTDEDGDGRFLQCATAQ